MKEEVRFSLCMLEGEGGGGDVVGILRAGERENTDQAEEDGGNAIHQTSCGGEGGSRTVVSTLRRIHFRWRTRRYLQQVKVRSSM